MGLTCSLLGHAFEADGVEREREQRGDEVVTVVRETETCSRCGEQRVVSETTEVTSVIDRDETTLDAGSGTGTGTGEEPAPDRDAGGSASGALGNFVDRADAEDHGEVDRGGPDAPGDGSGEPTHPRVDPDATEEPYEPPEDPAEEDAEILAGGPDEDDDRDPGQWPDDGTAAEAPADDDADGPAPPATDVPDGTAPSDSPDASGSDSDSDSDSGSASSPGPVGGSGAGRFVCGECGFATPAAGSSFREGDSCPECNTGWLVVESGERNP